MIWSVLFVYISMPLWLLNLHYIILYLFFVLLYSLVSSPMNRAETRARVVDATYLIANSVRRSWCGFVKSSVRRRTDLCNILETLIFWFVCQVMWIAQCVLASNVHSNKHLIIVDVTVVFYKSNIEIKDLFL